MQFVSDANSQIIAQQAAIIMTKKWDGRHQITPRLFTTKYESKGNFPLSKKILSLTP